MGTSGIDGIGRAEHQGAALRQPGARNGSLGLPAAFAVTLAVAIAVVFAIATATAIAAPPTTTATPSPAPDGNDGWFVTSGTGANGTPVTVQLEAADGGDGVQSISYRWNGGTWITEPGDSFLVPNGGTNGVPTGNGIHLLEYYATDDLDNDEDIQELEIKRDFTPPVLLFSPDPEVPTAIGGAWLPTVQLEMVGVDLPPQNSTASTSGLDTVEHRLGTSGTWVDGATPLPLNSVGTYTVQGRATDIAGNNTQQNFSVVVEGVTGGLRMQTAIGGRKQTKRRKAVNLRFNARNQYTGPMNLQTTVCIRSARPGLIRVQGPACQTHYSLAAGQNFASSFRVRPTPRANRQARNRAKRKGDNRRVQTQLRFTVTSPGYGSRTSAQNLRVRW